MNKIFFVFFMIASIVLSMASCNNSNSPDLDENDGITEDSDVKDGSNDEGELDDSENSDGGVENSEDELDTYDGGYIFSINSKKYHFPTCRFVATMNESSKVEFSGTVDELSELGYSPCKTCKPAPDYDYDSAAEEEGSEIREYAYVMNSKSMKLHLPSCSSAKNINAENKLYSNETRNVLINQGYTPCGICKP